jgi:hypothetical protein
LKVKPLADYLEDQGVGIVGQNIFVQHLPEDSGTPALMLKNSLEGTAIDYELPGYRKGKFQAVVRCKANKFEMGEAFAQLVSDTLTIQNLQIGNMHFNYLRPSSEPIGYQLSDGANYEFSVNFTANYVIVV